MTRDANLIIYTQVRFHVLVVASCYLCVIIWLINEHCFWLCLYSMDTYSIIFHDIYLCTCNCHKLNYYCTIVYIHYVSHIAVSHHTYYHNMFIYFPVYLTGCIIEKVMSDLFTWFWNIANYHLIIPLLLWYNVLFKHLSIIHRNWEFSSDHIYFTKFHSSTFNPTSVYKSFLPIYIISLLSYSIIVYCMFSIFCVVPFMGITLNVIFVFLILHI